MYSRSNYLLIIGYRYIRRSYYSLLMACQVVCSLNNTKTLGSYRGNPPLGAGVDKAVLYKTLRWLVIA